MLAVDAFADYSRITASSSHSTGFAGAKWNPTPAEPATADYLVANGYYLCPKSGEAITCNSITFGEVGGTKGRLSVCYDFSISDNGIVFANGSAHTQYQGARTIAASATVTSPASAPFVFTDDSTIHRSAPYRNGGGITFPSSFSGAAGTGFTVLATTNNFTVTISGDASSYFGSATVMTTNRFCNIASAALALSGTTFGGSVTCKANTTLNTAGSTGSSVAALALENGGGLSLAKPLTVGDLALDDYGLSFAGISASSGACYVTNSLTFAGEGKIPLRYTTSMSLPPSSRTEIPVLRLAPGIGFGVEDFEVVKIGFASETFVLEESVDGETGVKTLSLVAYPQKRRNLWPNESIEYGQNGGTAHVITDVQFLQPTNWPDSLIPHSGVHYYVDRVKNPTTGTRGTTYVRTPYTTDGLYEFGGMSLRLLMSVHFVLMSHTASFPRLDLTDNNWIYCALGFDTTFRGEIYIDNTTATIQPGGGKLFTHDGRLLGSGTLRLRCRGSSNDNIRGNVYLAGTNTDYSGKIYVTTDKSADTPRWKSSRFATLYVANPLNLGGPLSTFAADALKLDNMSVLSAMEDVTFADQTRGLSLEGVAQLTTPADVTMSLCQPVAFNATVYKNSAGTLALGGSLSFRDSSGELTNGIPESAALRTLQITAGTLKPLAARSMDGLDVVFGRNTNADGSATAECFFERDVATADAELAEYGAIDVKTETPFALAAGQPVVTVRLNENGTVPQTGADIALCTVKASAADAVDGVFKVARKTMLGGVNYTTSIVRENVLVDDVSAVTFKVRLNPPPGLLLILR